MIFKANLKKMSESSPETAVTAAATSVEMDGVDNNAKAVGFLGNKDSMSDLSTLGTEELRELLKQSVLNYSTNGQIEEFETALQQCHDHSNSCSGSSGRHHR